MYCVWFSVAPLERLHPQDCAEIYRLGIKENGIYTIQPDLHRPALEVFKIHHTRKTHRRTPHPSPLLFYRCVCYLWITKI